MFDPNFIKQRRLRIESYIRIPVQNRRARVRCLARFRWMPVLQYSREFSRWKRNRILLHPRKIADIEFLTGREDLDNPVIARLRRPRVAQLVFVTAWKNIMIRCGHKMPSRVVSRRILADRQKSGPFIISGIAGYRKQSMPALSNRRLPARYPSDISIAIRI